MWRRERVRRGGRPPKTHSFVTFCPISWTDREERDYSISRKNERVPKCQSVVAWYIHTVIIPPNIPSSRPPLASRAWCHIGTPRKPAPGLEPILFHSEVIGPNGRVENKIALFPFPSKLATNQQRSESEKSYSTASSARAAPSLACLALSSAILIAPALWPPPPNSGLVADWF